MKTTSPILTAGTLVVLALMLQILLVGRSVAQTPPLSSMEQLGKDLFFDEISHPSGMSCASCHGPTAGWAGPTSEINAHEVVYPAGTDPARFGNRKPPSAAYATLSPILHYDEQLGAFVGGNFSDGRATGEKLGNPAADQALGPFLNPVEMNNPTKANVLQQIAVSPYAATWEQVWGEPLQYDTPEKVEQNYDRVGLAVAAYEGSREVNRYTSKYDYYLKGMVELSAEESKGLQIFNGRGKCNGCHTSSPGAGGEPPLFTDFSYENLGVPKNPENPFYDMDEVFLDDGSPINPEGDAWIDNGLGAFLATVPEWADLAGENLGKHKTPTLRNIALAPGEDFIKAFMHNGVLKSLEEVVHFYNTRDDGSWPSPEVSENMNTSKVGNLNLKPAQEADLVAFLKTLSDGYPITSIPGDFNYDGIVDGYDLSDPLLGWEAKFGIDLDGNDFLVWQRQYGLGVGGTASSSPVPEPNTASLLLVIAAALLLRHGAKVRLSRK